LVMPVQNGAIVDYPCVPLGAPTVLASPAATVDLQNISQGYRHLEVYFQVRSENAALGDYMTIRVNGDTGANYDFGTANPISGLGISLSGGQSESRFWFTITAGSAPQYYFSGGKLTFMNYTDSDHFKTFGMHGAGNWFYEDTQRGGQAGGGTWRAIGAVNRLTFGTYSAANLAAGSRFALYGVK
jgi:hypothetical protein